MIKKKWLLNGLCLVITITSLSLSLFKYDNQVWIAAWITPVFLIRFMRNNKWLPAVVSGALALHIAFGFGMSQMFSSLGMGSAGGDIASIMMTGSLQSGTMFLGIAFLIPFLLDKALYKYVPKSVSNLIFPSALVSIELLYSFSVGTLYCFGQSQLNVQPFIMSYSLFGVYSGTFLIGWCASVINTLWEENWDIKKLGISGIVFGGIVIVILLYGAIASVFPKKADKTVPVAGIVTECHFDERLFSTGFSFLNPETNPSAYTTQLKSPDSRVEEMRKKTIEAIESGAKIIIWQEFALTLEASVADTLLTEMKNLADKKNVYLLVSYARILNNEERNDRIMKNLSILFTPEGDKAWEYAKTHPIPGSENLAVEAGSGDIPFVDTPYGRIGQVICYDSQFPRQMRQAAVKNIDILISPAYDGSAFTPLHTFTDGFRAVENGFTMVRITGNGLSAVIDPYYRLWSSQNTYEQGTGNFYYDVPVLSQKTFYGMIGFIFPYMVVILLFVLIIYAIILTLKKRME